ncbi:3-mercaptopyruvate sulfurtransferase [Pararhizobium arenae]|uniref:3-mercaptopyruvate sulfurtransferase n=1 Tax=Pararhizobium arenae TaxID=1856850 RepID=UPI00094AB77A|nr:3-mercaptopyruvate sulfurtransferase [Pararhizobium arenae]
MPQEKSRFVVSPDWLQDHLNDPAIRVVDASWYLPAQKRDPKAEYAAGHIPGAVFYDQDLIADLNSGLPHTIPSVEAFADAVGKLGISDTNTIVVYDGPGIFSAPRVWWLLRTFGVKDVFVLDGGLDGWKAQGRPLSTDTPTPAPAVFHADFDATAVTSFEAMKGIVDDGSRQIADARGAGRFSGEEPEPRAGMRSGHMPGAKNLPSSIFSENGHLKPLDDLKTIIENAGIDLQKPVTTTCGSGVTAAIIMLSLQSLGHTDNTLYDGSWSEWGSRADTSVITGKD